MVHTNAQVPPVFKFHHLQSCVTGDAAEVIGSLESSSENYEIAWKLLTNRYDNRKFIAESHVRALFNISFVSKDFSVRALIDKLQKHVRALHALKQPVDQWDLVLIHLIKEKLPNNLRDKWEESAGTSKIRSQGCRQCRKRYNSLLHFDQQNKEVPAQSSSESRAPLRQYHFKASSKVYLATAIVDVLDNERNYQPCRIMLDGGAHQSMRDATRIAKNSL